MIELASDALLRPRLNAAEFDKVRERAIQSIAAARTPIAGLVGQYGNAWLFRGHPYGRPVGAARSRLPWSPSRTSSGTTRRRCAATA